MINEDDGISSADVVVLPPNTADAVSYCEDIDDDDAFPGNSSPADVVGDVEIHNRNQESSNDDESETDVYALAVRKVKTGRYCKTTTASKMDKITPGSGPKPSSLKSSQPKFKWSKTAAVSYDKQPINNEVIALQKMMDNLADHSELDLFHEMFDEDIIDFIYKGSKLYAHQQNRHNFQLKKFELKRFIGFLLFSGYHKLPREIMYWETADDCNIKVVTESISLPRFREIKRNQHLADNGAVNKNDKLYKVREYIDNLNHNFMKFGCFAYKLFIDEQMVPYFERHSCKMYMMGKSVRFGFKVWCLCSSKGYLFNSIPYVGKDKAFDKEMGLGVGVVLQLLDVLENPQEHEIYFDNFFTSYKLMIRLSERFFCHGNNT